MVIRNSKRVTKKRAGTAPTSSASVPTLCFSTFIILLRRDFLIQFFFQITVPIPGGLEVKAGLGVAQFLEETRGIDGIEGLLHGEAAVLHKSGNHVLHDFLLHVLKFCLRYVHAILVSLSTASCVQKAYWKVMPLMYWIRRRNSSKVM